MQHPILLILFICFHCLLSVASPPSERHIGLGFDDVLGPEAFPVGFDDRAADAAECATCGSIQPKPSITPKLEKRNRLFLGEETKRGQRPEAGTEVRSSVEKQRRQVPPDANADGLTTESDSDTQRVTSVNDPGQRIRRLAECVLEKTKDCSYEQCVADGGSCMLVNYGTDGNESCRRARRLASGMMEPAGNWLKHLPSCRKCKCRAVYRWKQITDQDCLMQGNPPENCLRDKARRCYNAGARCIVGQHKNTSGCMKHTARKVGHLEEAKSPSPWAAEACQGCFCSYLRQHTGYGWNSVELSTNPTGFAALLDAAGPPPKRWKTSTSN